VNFLENKIISVSKKRQITIPLKFYNELNLGNEVECYVENNSLIIKPLIRDTSNFSVEILKDLVSKGYSGSELVKEFEEQSKYIAGSISKLIQEGNDIASGKIEGASYEDIFNDED
jgi:bifunctional DNA-binding transcriptional regulator/antitoxin component of YhaV-PrlF toxin-antitoxin module